MSRKALRDEIDRLRREMQQLRIELAETRVLADSTTIEPFVRRSASAALSALRRRMQTLRKGETSRAGTASAATPYVVRPRGAPAAVRVRVLHVIGNFHLGGSTRLVVDLIERLSQKYEHAVATRDLPPTPAYVGLAVEHHTASSLDGAAAVVGRHRPAFLHVHYLGHHRDKYGARDWEWYRHWFAAAERAGVPVIENINIPTEPFVSDAVACYVHVSDYVRERFGRRDGRHLTIHPGSDFSVFTPPSESSREADCLGMVYRLERDKLDERAIEPFIEAVRLRSATRALIVGGGSLLDGFRRRVADAGMEHAFTFTGYVSYEALPALYGRMSVFVAPVHRESFGQVTPFAMGSGLPVVGYDVGAIPEIIGDRALLAPAGDANRLGALAASLLDDDGRRAVLGASNRDRAARLFSVEAMIAAYTPLYAELAARRPNASHPA